MPSKPPLITSPTAPDLEDVARFLRDMLACGAFAALVTAVLALLSRMRDLNTELAARIAAKSRARPPSETLHRLQMELPLLHPPAANDGEAKPPPKEKKKKKRGAKTPTPHGRPELPAHLPRVPRDLLVPEAQRRCQTCGKDAATIGWKTAEKLNVTPAAFFVEVVRRETCACQDCHQYVVTAGKADEVLDRGLLGDELLIQALVDHYDDAVPWERMERSARLQGVPLAANTLAASVGRLIDLFDPVVDHIRERCLASDLLALDATSLPVLDVEHALGKRTAALWLLEGDHRYACFFYAPSGHAEHLDRMLAGAALRSVMCDGSATNNAVDRAGGIRGGCHAHARRKLVEALRLGDARAQRGIELYAALFAVDAASKRANETTAERLVRRHREAASKLAALGAWVEEQHRLVEPKSPLGKALGYLRRQWQRLSRFLHHEHLDLTNNEVERDLRRWVLDRKTWLFVGHEASARRLASALSILTTARKMGVEPRRYLRETLAKLLAGEKDITALLPETHAAKLASERDAPSVRAA